MTAPSGNTAGLEDESTRLEDPTDALEVLGNETRIAILRALAEADGPLRFTELRQQVDVRDSGRFNYHLSKLCEYFVRETTDGYELGHAGTRLIATADIADSKPGVDDSVAADTCPVCGEPECGKLFHIHLTPPWRES
ncbi:winged helix-turn-helix domain-containing protein [Halobacteria archaeon AArc-curdl1]|uniref:Winged helix-turn-helix domain-containing protein n=1 Tax=Natronosalvus hydrolyticus TaxID=2979988 RepID=A0AAP3E6W5_9EURY|nr:winged helix-turn-helix domain-containing protein [Halobacteria archaeon AArc-curdl1]